MSDYLFFGLGVFSSWLNCQKNYIYMQGKKHIYYFLNSEVLSLVYLYFVNLIARYLLIFVQDVFNLYSGFTVRHPEYTTIYE